MVPQRHYYVCALNGPYRVTYVTIHLGMFSTVGHPDSPVEFYGEITTRTAERRLTSFIPSSAMLPRRTDVNVHHQPISDLGKAIVSSM